MEQLYNEQKSKQHILQFIFPTHLWPSDKAKAIKPTMEKFERSRCNSVGEEAKIKGFF